VEFQVFSFTNKIRRLASHLELHKKDFSSGGGGGCATTKQGNERSLCVGCSLPSPL
ncbi:hypothetical protein ZWY2020_046341, partial [Hordeum vulgare]